MTNSHSQNYSGWNKTYSYMINSSSATGFYQAVNQYGVVVSNGTTADVPGQYAVNQLSSSAIGGNIYFKSNKNYGDYVTTKNIDLSGTSNIKLFAEKGTRIYIKSGSAETVPTRTIFAANGLTNAEITGFILDGNYTNLTNWTGSSAYGLIYLQGPCSHINITNNDFINARVYGVLLACYTGIVSYDVNTIGNRFNGGGFWNSIYYITYAAGADAYGITGCDISNNDIQNFCDIGICVGQFSSGKNYNINVHHNRIHDGNITGLGSGWGTPDAIFGIRAEGVDTLCDISHNNVWNVRQGVSCDGNYNTLQSNVINANLTGSISGISLLGNNNNVKLNHIFVGTTAWMNGVVIYGNNNVISYNDIYNSGSGGNSSGISDNGGTPSGSVVTYNNFHNLTYGYNTGSYITNIGNLTLSV